MIARFARMRRSDESGAAAVEFALLFPIFAILAMGTMAAGFAFARQINITQAAREGSRFGSTLSLAASHQTGSTNDGTIDTWLQKVYDAASGSAGSGIFAGTDSICVAYVDSSNASATWHLSASGGTKSSGICPGSNSNNGLSVYVQVVITKNTGFNFLVADPTLTLSSSSTTPFEAT